MKTTFVRSGLFLIVGSSAWAHHSFASEFDVNKPLNLRGRVVHMEWLNPHSVIQIAVSERSGKTSQWTIECAAPNALIRRGLTKQSLPQGAEILVAGWQAKDNSLRANGSYIAFQNGSRLSLGSSHENDRYDPHGSPPATVLAPYPVYVTGGFDDYAPPAPPVPVTAAPYPVPPQEQAQTPPDAANPSVADDANRPLPQSLQHDEPQPADPASYAANQPIVFLIAMKDHTIVAAVAYWVDGDTLNYIDMQGSKNSAPLDSVDRELSARLNQERKIDFGLPEK